jgi:hypothetical protein
LITDGITLGQEESFCEGSKDQPSEERKWSDCLMTDCVQRLVIDKKMDIPNDVFGRSR